MKNLIFITALLFIFNLMAKDVYEGPKFKFKDYKVTSPKVHDVDDGHHESFKVEEPQERDVASDEKKPAEDKKEPEVPYWNFKK
tara:strand:+ start:17137 stop:17388 length:252 start_codon:yes stop_codon:yes gene_type:complete